MFADQVEGFVNDLKELTIKNKLRWERFPLNYPVPDNVFVKEFIRKHIEFDANKSYFFSHENGLVLFIRYNGEKVKEAVYVQKHYGEPVIDLTEGYAMDEIVESLGYSIDKYIEKDEALPDGLYAFFWDIRRQNYL